MSITAFLIGGPKGGEVMTIPRPVPTIKAAVYRPVRWEDSWEASNDGPAVRSVDYQREGQHKDWAVYRYKPSAEDVLEDAKRLVEAVEAGPSHLVMREAEDFRRTHLGGGK
jgi:hypothetical protein